MLDLSVEPWCGACCKESEAIVFNLDKMGYASDLTSIEAVLSELGR